MNKGFTLIELLVALSIIGLLMSVATVSYNTVNQRSRNAKRVSDLEQVRNALEMYKSDQLNNSYPQVTGFVGLGNLQTIMSQYIPAIPTDPNPGNPPFHYQYGNNPVNPLRAYFLCARMEGTSIPQAHAP